MKSRVIACVLVVACAGSGVRLSGDQQVPDAPGTQELAQLDGVGGVPLPAEPNPALITIIGSARTALNQPLPMARLRLRNARIGRVDAFTVSDADGSFTFERLEPGTYVAEIVDENGDVLAASELLNVNPGETVAVVVKLPFRAKGAGWWFGTAAAVLGAAAAAGVLATAPTTPAASPETLR
jgi:hypothetical protein